MTKNLYKVLNDKFGFSSFRKGQKEIIESILNEEDVVAIMPTGMGKSLCYQIPGYLMPHTVIIISPLLSLMQDQVEQLKKRGEKRVVAFNSFLTPLEKQQFLQRIESYKFIFLSPEMLMQDLVKAKLQSIPISLIVADEAHCISQWGYDFRPDYLRLGEWLHEPTRPPILALTATATQQVMNDITLHLNMVNPTYHMQSLDRPNIRYSTVEVDSSHHKFESILKQIESYSGPGILYTQSRKKADEYALKLSAAGIRIASYHAGMDQVDRMFVQQQFLQNEIEWVCATNAFGMGVHKDDVRQVIHDHFPSSVANYAQEVGRAGRDGTDALATLFYTIDDEHRTIFVATNDFPEEIHVKIFNENKYNGMSANQLVSQGLLSENHVRILDYWSARKTEEDTISMLQQLRQEKVQQIHRMKEIITNSLCIRHQIVQTFGQQLADKPQNCCSKCGLNTDEIVHSSQERSQQILLSPWQNRLSLLFPRG
ncbi:RecQ family ATP-dependent DNA helicase [Paenisporosarcina indica]|uniref:RecQ family ATP-dependent DNA helicase n=1 Tax=Paenisporosarcina indica TaxID=650093 RepID=UPI00094F91D2|nr:RecQ family ATP-dependent DNA helicase [Paenisporosarcina indica]